MFGWGYPEILLLGLLVVGVLAAITYLSRPVRVAVDMALIPSTADLDAALFARLRQVPKCSLDCPSPGSYQVRTSRIPGWAILAMLLTLPFGLLFLLARVKRELHLVVVERDGPTILRITGTAEATTWARISRAIGPLVAIAVDNDVARPQDHISRP